MRRLAPQQSSLGSGAANSSLATTSTTTTTTTTTTTIIFNVGGRRFELSASLLLDKYPDSALSQLVREKRPHSHHHHQQQREIFLDHNPEAFSVVVDYLRYGGGRILVPPTVCAEVVTLQLKQLGLIPAAQQASSAAAIASGIETDEKQGIKRSVGPSVEQLSDLPPSYEQTVGTSGDVKGGSSGGVNELGRLAGETMLARLQSLVKSIIHPLLVEHARRGHMLVCFYLVDVRFIPREVASTIEDDLAVEWVLLTDGSRLVNTPATMTSMGSSFNFLQQSSSSSSSYTTAPSGPHGSDWININNNNTNNNSNNTNNNNNSTDDNLLIATLRSTPGISSDQVERLVTALRASRAATNTSSAVSKERTPGLASISGIVDYPDTSYLLQTGVFQTIETMIRKQSNAISAVAERRDLTVRRENEYGLIGSSSIVAVRLLVRLA